MVEPVVKHKPSGRELCIEEMAYFGSESDLSDYEINGVPAIENINSKILAAIQKGGRLDMAEWHSQERCGTAHCIAGWAVHLAGKAGYELEALVPINMDGDNTPVAAALIFAASGCPIIPNFFDTNEDAMDALKARAALEQAG